jgi:hypothetical protein
MKIYFPLLECQNYFWIRVIAQKHDHKLKIWGNLPGQMAISLRRAAHSAMKVLSLTENHLSFS